MRILRAFAICYDFFLLLIVFLVLTHAILTPIYYSNGEYSSSPILSFSCHQQKDRSLMIFGNTMLICSRCTGVYLGYLFGRLYTGLSFRSFLMSIKKMSRNELLLILSLFILGFSEWGIENLGLVNSTNAVRFLSGFFLGLFMAKLLHGIGLRLIFYLLERR